MHILRVNILLLHGADPRLFLDRENGWTRDRTRAMTYETTREAKWAAEAVGGRVFVTAKLGEQEPPVWVKLPRLTGLR